MAIETGFPCILTKKVMGKGRGERGDFFEESPFFCYFGQGLVLIPGGVYTY